MPEVATITTGNRVYRSGGVAYFGPVSGKFAVSWDFTGSPDLAQVTWWPPKNFDEARLSEPLHLFGRRGRSPFLYLGRLAFVKLLDDGPPGGLLLRLVDADGLLTRADDADEYPGLRQLLDLAIEAGQREATAAS